MKGKKVVVTGGAGFIGSNLAETLSEHNEVIVIDNLSTGREINIRDLIERECIQFRKGTITDLKMLKRIFNEVDYVFHQGALPSVPRSIKSPLETHDANVNGTLNVLIAARDCDARKVVFASSSSVYGDIPVLPKREEMVPSPLSPYAVTKLGGEYYCRVFYKVYGLPTTSLRYFNVFGPKQDPTSQYAAVIPNFITAFLNNRQPNIYGDGEQTRDFTYVRDAVEANILAAEHPESDGEVINIAGGKRITINVLADIIGKMLDKDIEPVHTDPRPGDIRHSLADIEKAKKLLGFTSRYTIEAGLKETIEYFKKEIFIVKAINNRKLGP